MSETNDPPTGDTRPTPAAAGRPPRADPVAGGVAPPSPEIPGGAAGEPQKPPTPPEAGPPAKTPKPAPVPPAPQTPRSPGGAARLAKSATIVAAGEDQPPLAGSADLGWWVLNTVMTLGLIALAAIALYSCAKAATALFSVF